MDEGGRRSCGMDPLIKNLVGGAAKPPDVAPIAGYLGGKTADGRCRIYVDDTLDFFDFDTEDVVHIERVDERFGGSSVVWLNDKAQLERSSGHTDASEDEFLHGDVAETPLLKAHFISKSRGGGSDSRLWRWSRRAKRWVCI